MFSDFPTSSVPVTPQKIHVIACGGLQLDLTSVIQSLQIEATIKYLPCGLHDNPAALTKQLQQAIDDASTVGAGERIVICYGTRDKGTTCLRARNIPLAIPLVLGASDEQMYLSQEILQTLLTAQITTDQVLIVPPQYKISLNETVENGHHVTAVPVWQSESEETNQSKILIFDDPAADDNQSQSSVESSFAHFGLGIDAGGTYTDVVLYDFDTNKVLGKAKAPTTRWDHSIGIGEALSQIDPEQLQHVGLVSISTTLATNAIVENRGQRAGLFIMPPYGMFSPADITFRPIQMIAGKLEINGKEIEPIDPDEIRRYAQEMIETQGVSAFAVCGYASHNNPAHELAVKTVLTEATGMSVTCAHEVSDGLNYRVRAVTAALNSRIIPCIEALIDDVTKTLHARGIHAPMMMVKSDGSLMGLQQARTRPIETILSGPASSVAGARHLAGVSDAVVIDIGGTTSDTALIVDGRVLTCAEGARVGGWRTQVESLNIRTLGLGGDSLITIDKQEYKIGPRRVKPICQLAKRDSNTSVAISWLATSAQTAAPSTERMALYCLRSDGSATAKKYGETEGAVLRLLKDRPHSLHELAEKVVGDKWAKVPLDRLEDDHLIERCGLTPTDLLHAAGKAELGDVRSAQRMVALHAKLLNLPTDKFIEQGIEQIVQRLAVESLKKQLNELDERLDADALDTDPVCRALMKNLFAGGGSRVEVAIRLKHPIIGIGGPAKWFIPAAARYLKTEAIVPSNADVANAVGAITSRVLVHREVRIIPDEKGKFALRGLLNTPTFANFDDAREYAITTLCNEVRAEAASAGTRQRRVEVTLRNHAAPLASGGELFLGCTIIARLDGRPDQVFADLTPSS